MRRPVPPGAEPAARCRRCGAVLRSADAVCPACGLLRARALARAAPPPGPRLRPDLYRFVALVCAAVGLGIGALLGCRVLRDAYARLDRDLALAPWYVAYPAVAGVVVALAVLVVGRALIALLRIEEAVRADAAPR